MSRKYAIWFISIEKIIALTLYLYRQWVFNICALKGHNSVGNLWKGHRMISQILEAGMLICFGLSWPTNAYKSYKARTAVGTS